MVGSVDFFHLSSLPEPLRSLCTNQRIVISKAAARHLERMITWKIECAAPGFPDTSLSCGRPDRHCRVALLPGLIGAPETILMRQSLGAGAVHGLTDGIAQFVKVSVNGGEKWDQHGGVKRDHPAASMGDYCAAVLTAHRRSKSTRKWGFLDSPAG